MSAHTPGPWFFNYDSIATNDRDHVGYPPKDTIVASLYDDEYIDNKNREADGPLIAAAPDLLAACEAAFKHMPVYSGAIGMQLHAAITKARGK